MYRVRSKLCKDVEAFHKKFKLGYKGPPRLLEHKISDARYRHLFEELQELASGNGKRDKEKILDALVDIVYVALGTAYLQGFNFDEAWRRIHKTNMKKIRMATKRSPLDVVKPVGWRPPDLKDLCQDK